MTPAAGTPRPIFTIGYEGASLDDLVATLEKAGAAMLVDVRAVPWSRKPGFGKTDLAAGLSSEGIDYLHLGALGNPEPGRHAAKEGRTEDYRRHLDAQLDGEAGRSALDRAARLARTHAICLMCFEADPARCHRAVVAERLAARTGRPVTHLRIGPESLPLFRQL